MKGIIDRFEGDYVVVELEDETMKDIEKSKVPKEAKEGDVIDITEKITIDYEETEKRREEIEKLTRDLWE